MKLVPLFIGIIVAVAGGLFLTHNFESDALGAAMVNYQRSLIPIDATENVGTTTNPWDEGHFNEICLGADCKAAWPTVSGGAGNGTIATSTSPTLGDLAYWTGVATIGSVASGTLSESVTGLELSASRYLVGGAAALSLTSGYVIPLSASTTEWATAYGWGDHATAGYDQVTTAGDGLTRTLNDFDCDTASGTTFGCLSSANWTTFNNKQDTITAGDALTLTGTDIDFDGGTIPAGALGGTWASPTVDDDGHAHTGATLSSIDMSDDTNLTADGTEIVLTNDALSLGNTLSFTNYTATNGTTTNATSTSLAVTTTFNFLGDIITNVLTWLDSKVEALTNVALPSNSVWRYAGVLGIPYGAAPTTTTNGDIGIDSTANQFKYQSGGTTNILSGTTTRSVNIASTTKDARGNSFDTATSTFLLTNDAEPFTLIGWYCKATTTGSVNVRFGDGTNWTNDANCSTGGVTYATSNNTFTSFEDFQIQIGSGATSPSRVTVSTITSKTSQ